ncbi:MAG: glycosyltransferase [Ignavibacteriales bacterium]|nr:glycosyltransferase [Ignavibacteriales bacterium]MCB9218683.1 glycosyltransferase [Ignavibacteriales bacterium]MCB9259311.1 glycosyltransferase [Ignavibacteriales bacterium]
MFEILFLIIISAYFIQSFILSIGAKKEFPKLSEDKLPTASVIVAARNEENNIENCLKSLNDLQFPDDKLEIIIVNDDSTDNTESIIKNFIADKPRFKLIKPDKNFGETFGKARAIANAVEIASGEIILTTDADCVVSPTWAKTICSYYQDNIAMVCGYTNQRADNLFEAVQDIDFIYLLAVAGGAINLGKPLSAIGNNMSYRKSAYNEVGGYANIQFSVTEDFQLLMAINKLKDRKIIYPIDPGGLVTSAPCPDLKTLFRQKRRWAIGGMKSRLDNLLIISTGFWAALFTWIGLFLYTPTVLVLILLRVFADLFMVYFVYKKLNLKFSLFNFIGFQIYSNIYFVVTAISLFFSRKVMWKGRKF